MTAPAPTRRRRTEPTVGDRVELARYAAASEERVIYVATLARHYVGVIAELEGQPRTPAADAIRQARSTVSSCGWRNVGATDDGH